MNVGSNGHQQKNKKKSQNVLKQQKTLSKSMIFFRAVNGIRTSMQPKLL